MKLADSIIIARFAASVRKFRSDLGISQEQLAERAGLHRSYIADIERGKRNITLLSIEKLAGGLGVSAADLFAKAIEPEASLSGHTERPLTDKLANVLR